MTNSISTDVQLRGITWDHTRGLLPVVATAQRFAELHPGVEVLWQKRSLQQFADSSLADLAASYDLLVIDHPSIGEAAAGGLLLPLEQHLPEAFLADQAEHSVGQSHASYFYEGHQYALAIDAATPVAGWRPDLLAAEDLPRTWEDVLALARRGLVTVPAIPIDSLMNVFMLANALGAEPFTSAQVIAEEQGCEALQLLRELVHLAAAGSLERNPIRTWQLLATSDRIAYCPFAYGYSNYSRAGYTEHTLETGPLVSLRGQALRSTLGGAGLAVSARCRNPEWACRYAAYTASADVQSTVYALAGGQPGHRAAWRSPMLNNLTQHFFAATLKTLDQAWMRPRYPGFIEFQEEASNAVHRYLVHGGRETDVLKEIDKAYMKSRRTQHRNTPESV